MSVNINLDATEVFEWNYEVLDLMDTGEKFYEMDDLDKLYAKFKYRYVFNRGGSRSSKTYSILQMIIIKCLQEPKIIFDIIRKTLTALRASAMKDFFDILKEMNLYNKQNHNKTNNEYTFPNGSVVCFYGADDEQKLRGRKRTYAYLNECTEFFQDDIVSVDLRCERQMWFDYNPSESTSWIYDYELYNNAIMFKSTFLNNSFLSTEQVAAISSLKTKDPEKWAIFGLGERVTSRTNVYNHFQIVADKPYHFKEENYVYGLDWGYNDPNAILKVYYDEESIYVEEVLYQSYMTVNDVVEFLDDNLISKTKEIIVDYARPENTSVLQQNGYNCVNANKRIKAGIDAVKAKEVFINENAINTIKEYENYRWKKKGDTILDEAVDLWNHSLDALRYAVYYIDLNKTHNGQPRFTISNYK